VADKVVVLVTCANTREAKRIARAAVEARLAACVSVLAAPVHSVYRWKGKVEQASEVLLLMKTSRRKLHALRAAVERLHSYDVPEFIAFPIAAGSPAYLRWLDECLRPAARGRKPR
jgi:periplasmic divalent cation tolerance protein